MSAADYRATDPRPVLRDDTLYIGDNGRCFCGRHAGASAKYSGRDISGQKVYTLTPKRLTAAKAAGVAPKCEGCR